MQIYANYDTFLSLYLEEKNTNIREKKTDLKIQVVQVKYNRQWGLTK